MSFFTWEIREENARRRKQNDFDDVFARHVPLETVVLSSPALMQAEDAARLLLQGLADEYFYCLTSGRLDKWRAAAVSIAELVAIPPTEAWVVSREEAISSHMTIEGAGERK